LVDKWGCDNEPIITSLRNTFGTSGSGAERLEHVVANFILPMQQQRDVDPKGEVARYDYDKLQYGREWTSTLSCSTSRRKSYGCRRE
jgi:hypothetical protein